jgi:hypothetical protein
VAVELVDAAVSSFDAFAMATDGPFVAAVVVAVAVVQMVDHLVWLELVDGAVVPDQAVVAVADIAVSVADTEIAVSVADTAVVAVAVDKVVGAAVAVVGSDSLDHRFVVGHAH